MNADAGLNRACIAAIWEVEELARTLPSLLPDTDTSACYAARCVTNRIAVLANAFAGSLDGASVIPVDELTLLIVLPQLGPRTEKLASPHACWGFQLGVALA